MFFLDHICYIKQSIIRGTLLDFESLRNTLEMAWRKCEVITFFKICFNSCLNIILEILRLVASTINFTVLESFSTSRTEQILDLIMFLLIIPLIKDLLALDGEFLDLLTGYLVYQSHIYLLYI